DADRAAPVPALVGRDRKGRDRRRCPRLGHPRPRLGEGLAQCRVPGRLAHERAEHDLRATPPSIRLEDEPASRRPEERDEVDVRGLAPPIPSRGSPPPPPAPPPG